MGFGPSSVSCDVFVVLLILQGLRVAKVAVTAVKVEKSLENRGGFS